eukprot:219512_1
MSLQIRVRIVGWLAFVEHHLRKVKAVKKGEISITNLSSTGNISTESNAKPHTTRRRNARHLSPRIRRVSSTGKILDVKNHTGSLWVVTIAVIVLFCTISSILVFLACVLKQNNQPGKLKKNVTDLHQNVMEYKLNKNTGIQSM